jgi:hypothetical protein
LIQKGLGLIKDNNFLILECKSIEKVKKRKKEYEVEVLDERGEVGGSDLGALAAVRRLAAEELQHVANELAAVRLGTALKYEINQKSKKNIEKKN